MATRLEKMLWTLLAGMAMGLAGCESDPEPGDGDTVDEREETSLVDTYGAPYDVWDVEEVPE